MTTDELVKLIVEGLQVMENAEFNAHYARYMRLVRFEPVADVTFSTFSVALNDETRDVRYVTMVSDNEHVIEAYEVTPQTVLRTVYRRV